MIYLILILITWIINGSIKFVVNCIRHRNSAIANIGCGGFPSTHTAVVSAQLIYIIFEQGMHHPVVAALMVLLWVVVNDAIGVRMRVQEHAKHLNELNPNKQHREHCGHTMVEIIGGVLTGSAIGLGFYYSKITLTF